MRTEISKLLQQHAEKVAPQLLGWKLIRTIDGHKTVVRIVETEAYHQTDAASHSYNGETPRTKIMFGQAGKLYVYFTYGMHYCCNIVTGGVGEGSAVLIRAVEPIEGMALLEDNRPGVTTIQLTNGPAKLCQALKIDLSFNGHDLADIPLVLAPGKLRKDEIIAMSERIGISKETDKLWRFYIKDNPYVSRPS